MNLRYALLISRQVLALQLVLGMSACSSGDGSNRSVRGGDLPGDGDGDLAGDGDGDAIGDGDGDGDDDNVGDGDGSAVGDGSDAGVDAGPKPSYEEVFEQGITRYVDLIEETEVSTSGDLTLHHFSGENRGPICMYGEEFFVETREGSSDTLMIFLQGGGVCLTEVCAATPAPILSLQLFNLASTIGIGGLLNSGNPDNPTADFDVVNAPYCDGSLFAGDVDRILSDGNDSNGEADQAYQRGLQNLTATLLTAKKLHPNPPRIVLAGSSGGAYGVVAGTVLIRYFYPNVPLLVLSDSGAPIVNGIDKGFITRALTEFNALKLIPRSCPNCLANGHATGMLEWAMSFDDKLSVAYMTHARDHVIGEFFMGTTAQQFEDAVVSETSRIIDKFPGRAFRFVIPTDRHTLTMGLDDLPDDAQGLFLGAAGGLGFGFIGPDVTSEALSTWAMGGMKETGKDDTGASWTGYDWVRSLINDPQNTPNILQLEE